MMNQILSIIVIAVPYIVVFVLYWVLFSAARSASNSMKQFGELLDKLTLPTAKAGGFLLQPSLPTIDRSYTMSTSVGITPSFRVPHGTYV